MPNWGLIDTNRSKTSYSMASVDDAVGLNVDWRAGWEWVEHSVLTYLMLGSVAVRTRVGARWPAVGRTGILCRH